jgi:predicted transcriptional regulator
VQMKKDTQFTFRVPTDLKSKLQDIAAVEGRSMAQICEAFLRAGTESYKKDGTKFLNRFLSRNPQVQSPS